MRGPRSWPTLGAAWQATAHLLPIALALAVPLSAVDLAYAVRAGQLILERGDVLRTDPFTFTAGGQAWSDQQWLAQVVFALVHDAAGWPGLALLRAALVGFGLLLVSDLLRRLGLDLRRAAIVTLIGFVVVAPALALRAQLFAVSLFALTLWLLAAPPARSVLRWLLVPVASLWANLHGTFFLLPLAVAVEGLAARAERRGAGRGAAGEVALLTATLLATLVNPFGLQAWTYILALGANPFVSGLASEWQPTSPATVPGALFLGALAVATGLVLRAPRRPSWPRLLWLAALAVLALRAERAIVWWALAAAPVLAPLLAGHPSAGALARRSPANAVIVGALAVAWLVGLPWWRAGPPGSPGSLLTDAPVGLTRQLEGRLAAETRAYVTQGWASWVEYALPAVKTFVDARFEVIPAAAWVDYLAIAGAQDGWDSRLDRWRVSLAIVDRTREPRLAAALAASPLWELIASDEDTNGVAYRRAVRSGWQLQPSLEGAAAGAAGRGHTTGERSARRRTNQ